MNHGRFYTYDRLGCRCPECRRSNRLRVQRWQLATEHGTWLIRTPADPVREHIAALRASGWTVVGIAEELRMSKRTIEKLTATAKAGRLMDRRTAAAILSLPPLEPVDIDPVVVERLIAGADWRSIGATRPERLAAAAMLPTTHDKRLGIKRSDRQAVAS